jgi:predicted nucleic acid-binding protein
MKTGVDTNIFSRIWLGGPEALFADRALRRCSAEGTLVISPVVYAELLANPWMGRADAESFLRQSRIAVEFALLPEVWSAAGLRFGDYAKRKRASGGGESRRLIADFVVGAHAYLQADRLLTLDVRRFQVDFPELKLVAV